MAGADIVITNVRQPALSKLGLDYDQVRVHRSDVIWVGVTAFGADGPYAGRPGIDFLIQGYGGLMALTGEPGGAPVRVTVPLIDTLTSVLVVTGAAGCGPLTRIQRRGPAHRHLAARCAHPRAGIGARQLPGHRRGDPSHGQSQPLLRPLGCLRHERRPTGGDHVSVAAVLREALRCARCANG